MRFVSTDQAQLKPPRWLVPGWIGRDHMTLFIGDGSAGKSTTLADLAVALAAGQPWIGIPTQTSRVILLDEDGSEPDLINRIVAFRAGRGLSAVKLDDHLRVHPAAGFSIDNDADFMELCKMGADADAIIFDALIAFHAKDENSAADMRQIMRGRFRTLMRTSGAAAIIAHHTPGPTEDGHVRDKPRGSTEIKNACDAIINCAAGRPHHSMKIKRLKFAPESQWGEPVNIGLEITDSSCRLIATYATKIASAAAFLTGQPDVLTLTVDQADVSLKEAGINVGRETAWKALVEAQARTVRSRSFGPSVGGGE